jgi:hypothetical protein
MEIKQLYQCFVHLDPPCLLHIIAEMLDNNSKHKSSSEYNMNPTKTESFFGTLKVFCAMAILIICFKTFGKFFFNPNVIELTVIFKLLLYFFLGIYQIKKYVLLTIVRVLFLIWKNRVDISGLLYLIIMRGAIAVGVVCEMTFFSTISYLYLISDYLTSIAKKSKRSKLVVKKPVTSATPPIVFNQSGTTTLCTKLTTAD